MFFKVVGIYATCVTIHKIGRVGGKVLEKCLDKIIDDRIGKRKNELKPKEVNYRSTYEVRNKIGF